MPVRRTFEFISGSVALDLLDTITERSSDVPTDLLRTDDDAVRWLEAGGLAPVDECQVVQLRLLRWAIESLADALPGRPIPEAATVLNRFAAHPDGAPQLPEGVHAAEPPTAAHALSTVARAAMDLLESPHRVRRCDGCAMRFLDTSRPGSRRWCSSTNKCGNRARLRRHRGQPSDDSSVPPARR
jgi:predicted RNA-binding Zn ribbon-like protein